MSAVADVLNGAADLIERDGWRQGPRTTDRRLCAIQAINRAGNGTYAGIAADYLRDVLGLTSILQWNDHPGRTKAEVVAALRAAAEVA